jgi:hypothetical protein
MLTRPCRADVMPGRPLVAPIAGPPAVIRPLALDKRLAPAGPTAFVGPLAPAGRTVSAPTACVRPLAPAGPTAAAPLAVLGPLVIVRLTGAVRSVAVAAGNRSVAAVGAATLRSAVLRSVALRSVAVIVRLPVLVSVPVPLVIVRPRSGRSSTDRSASCCYGTPQSRRKRAKAGKRSCMNTQRAPVWSECPDNTLTVLVLRD